LALVSTPSARTSKSTKPARLPVAGSRTETMTEFGVVWFAPNVSRRMLTSCGAPVLSLMVCGALSCR
jgi:hypothetical protein